jgi:amidase
MKKILIILILLIPFKTYALNKAPIDITNTNVIEIQEYIDKGYLTYETLVKLYLDRINEYDKDFNTIRIINENAIEEAKQLDLEFKKTGKRSIIHGIPIIVKDNIDVKGFPTTAGSRALLDSYPNENALIIQKLIDNGAIIIAKSNMSEFAFSARNSYSSFGQVRNAFNNLYTPYGSSGGSASAVALNFAPMALGTDTNSSIRLPASANNVIGIRSTYSLLSTEGILSYDKERDVVGPITDNIIDNAIFMGILTDQDYLSDIDKNTIRVGVLKDFIESKTSSLASLNRYDEDIANLTNIAINVLKDKQVEIVEIENFYKIEQENINYNTIFGRIFCYDFNQYIVNTSSKIKSYDNLLSNGNFVQNLYEYNISCNYDLRNNELARINNLKKTYQDYVIKTMDDNNVDVLLYPSTKSKTFLLSEKSPNLINITNLISPTTGFPAINVPMGLINDLPYGIEFLTKPNNEEYLYQISYLLEQNTNYNYTPKENLYDIIEINKLIELFEESKHESIFYKEESFLNYSNIYNEVKEYIVNYSNEEPKEQELYLLLQQAKQNLEYKVNNNDWYLIIPIILIALFITHKIFKRRP